MVLLRNGEAIANDYASLDDAAELPATGGVIVSFARWQKDRAALIARRAPLGLALKNDADLAAIAADIGHFSLIELDFPKFTDGRAFSQARWLREKLGFAGEIRAGGQVLRDQYLFMIRCGIDTVRIPEGKPASGYGEALREFSVWYQAAADRRRRAVDLRHRPALSLAAAE